MTTQKHIDELSETLKVILNAELKLGNEVVETSKGWPDDNTVIVFLKKPFLNTYESDAIEYIDVDDIHYWKSQYTDKLTGHVLASNFELQQPG